MKGETEVEVSPMSNGAARERSMCRQGDREGRMWKKEGSLWKKEIPSPPNETTVEDDSEQTIGRSVQDGEKEQVEEALLRGCVGRRNCDTHQEHLQDSPGRRENEGGIGSRCDDVNCKCESAPQNQNDQFGRVLGDDIEADVGSRRPSSVIDKCQWFDFTEEEFRIRMTRTTTTAPVKRTTQMALSVRTLQTIPTAWTEPTIQMYSKTRAAPVVQVMQTAQ